MADGTTDRPRSGAPAGAARFADVEISLIRQISALETPLSINLGLGEPNVEPDGRLRELAREVASTGSWHYSPNAGDPTLRRTIAAQRSEREVDPKSEVCVTAGSQEALYCIMQAFVDPGDEVLVPDPGFLAYPTLVRLAGGVAVPYTLEPPAWLPDLRAIERLITPRTRIIVAGSPSNPTGAVIDAATLGAIAELCEERGILLVSDEVYRHIHYGEAPPSALGTTGNAIVVDGMSKSHAMTGMRVGWTIASPEITAQIVKAHQYVATCANVFAQQLAGAILSRGEENERWLERVREQFAAQREAALFALGHYLGIEVAPPGGAFYLFVPVPSCASVALAHQLATDARVLTIPGRAFGDAGEGHLRISFAATPERVSEGIERIARYFDEQGM
jgi:aspartate aminotransferase